MEPQEPRNARKLNEHAPRPVKGIGGNGSAQVRSTERATVQLALRSEGPLELYPGAALKLAEQLVHEARRALLVLAKDAEELAAKATATTAPAQGAA